MNSEVPTGAKFDVLADCNVVLADGASVTISVRVQFDTAAQAISNIQDAVFQFFHLTDNTSKITLLHFKSDPSISTALCEHLRALRNATLATVHGLVVNSPPIKTFVDKSKVVTAILATGETVRLTFATVSGSAPPPSSGDVDKVFEILSKMKFSELKTIKTRLNEEVRPPNTGWFFLVLGLEQINHCCDHPKVNL